MKKIHPFKIKKRSLYSFLLQVTIVSIIIVLAVIFIDFSKMLESIKLVSIETILIVVSLVTCSRFLMSYKWLILLKALDIHPPFIKILSFYYQAAFLSKVLPSSIGAETLRGYLILKYANGWDLAIGSMIMERITSIFSIIVLSTISSLILINKLADSYVQHLYVFLIGIFFLSLIVFAFSLSDKFGKKLDIIIPTKKGKIFFQKLHKSYAKYRNQKIVLLRSFFYALLENMTQVFIVFAVAIGININASSLILLAAITLSQFLQRIAFVIEGWALGQFLLVLVCSLAGIDETEALTFSLISNAIRIVAISPGGILLAMNKFDRQ